MTAKMKSINETDAMGRLCKCDESIRMQRNWRSAPVKRGVDVAWLRVHAARPFPRRNN